MPFSKLTYLPDLKQGDQERTSKKRSMNEIDRLTHNCAKQRLQYRNIKLNEITKNYSIKLIKSYRLKQFISDNLRMSNFSSLLTTTARRGTLNAIGFAIFTTLGRQIGG